jgi:hypothetical protein
MQLFPNNQGNDFDKGQNNIPPEESRPSLDHRMISEKYQGYVFAQLIAPHEQHYACFNAYYT